MDHLQEFRNRTVLSLPVFKKCGWTLKRYAILADGRTFDEDIASSASHEAILRLPDAGCLSDAVENHGVGFQIIHFAQVAVVSPVFYWRWGCVLANIDQMRASWDKPTAFGNGVKDVVGCIWEMDVVSFEINAWKISLLNKEKKPAERLATYYEEIAACAV